MLHQQPRKGIQARGIRGCPSGVGHTHSSSGFVSVAPPRLLPAGPGRALRCPRMVACQEASLANHVCSTVFQMYGIVRSGKRAGRSPVGAFSDPCATCSGR
jgi:hypothetical protein